MCVAERGDCARVGRQLHEDDVTGIDKHAGSEVERLLRSGRDDHLVGRRAYSAVGQDHGQRLDERPVSARRTVLQYGAVRSIEERLRRVPELVPGEHIGCGKAGRKRNEVGHAKTERAHLADRRLLHGLRGTRKEAVVVGHAGWPRGEEGTRDRPYASLCRDAWPA